MLDVVVPPVSVSNPVAAAWDRVEFPLLRWVDPYGDTTFARLQLPAVADELTHLAAETQHVETRGVLELIRRLAERGGSAPHQVLVFVGD